jgi:hypothetical protein
MRRDSAVIVVVGDGPKIYDGLAAIAPVRIIDADGNPLTTANLSAEVEAIAFDASQLVAGRDSFVVLVQGNPLGALTRSIEYGTQDGRPVFMVKSQIRIGAMGGQSAEYVLDARTLDPISYEQAASQMGQTIQAKLAYAVGGRVSGSVSGAIEATIDTVFGSTAYDTDMLATLAQAMPLADGASFTIGIFNVTEQTFSNVTIGVADGGTVTVPAGEFETWQVSVSGRLPWVYWVSKNAPRRVVKMEMAGSPLSFELVATESR